MPAPAAPFGFESSFVSANGLRHHLVEPVVPSEQRHRGKRPLVLLIHGFPEGWYSWRHQLVAFGAAGYRVVATDVRGYGQTDAPSDVAAYRTRELVADAAGIVEALGEDNAVVVGHDWGAHIAWHCALLRPDRFRAIAALSIVYTGRPRAPPIAILRKRFAGTFFYMVYFQEPGVAEAELESDVRRSLRLIYCNASGDVPKAAGFAGKPPGSKLLDGMVDPPELPSWLSEHDLDVYAADFARHGFRGPLNRYRCMDWDWDDLVELAGAKVQIPAAFIAGDRDMSFQLRGREAIAAMKEVVPDLRQAVVLERAGHWVQQERALETNAALLAFLREVAPLP